MNGTGLRQVRAQLVQHQPASLQRLEDEGEVELLEVAQAAVEQLASSGSRCPAA